MFKFRNGNGHNKAASQRAVDLVRTAMLTGQKVLVENQAEVVELKKAMKQVGASRLRVETRGPAPRSGWVKPTAASPYAPELLAYEEAEKEARDLALEARFAGLRSEDLDLGLAQDDWWSKASGLITEYGPITQMLRGVLKDTALGQKLARLKITTPSQIVTAYKQGKITVAEYKQAKAALEGSKAVPTPTTTLPERPRRTAQPMPTARPKSFFESLFGK